MLPHDLLPLLPASHLDVKHPHPQQALEADGVGLSGRLEAVVDHRPPSRGPARRRRRRRHLSACTI